MSKCENCKEEVNLLNAYIYLGPGWIRWECPRCNYTKNYEKLRRPKMGIYKVTYKYYLMSHKREANYSDHLCAVLALIDVHNMDCLIDELGGGPQD